MSFFVFHQVFFPSWDRSHYDRAIEWASLWSPSSLWSHHEWVYGSGVHSTRRRKNTGTRSFCFSKKLRKLLPSHELLWLIIELHMTWLYWYALCNMWKCRWFNTSPWRIQDSTEMLQVVTITINVRKNLGKPFICPFHYIALKATWPT